MNPLLDRLGVPELVQAYFHAEELLFSYGNHFEHFDAGFHRVPSTPNLWLAGKELTREVIITSNAMEAIAWATFNHHRYPGLETLSFIAIGNRPHPGQLKWISAHYPKRKFTLVFGADLLGKLSDIKIGAGLYGKTIRLLRSELLIRIEFEHKVLEFEQARLSLSAFEKAAGIRTGIRTAKPKLFDTFLDQLKYHANQ